MLGGDPVYFHDRRAEGEFGGGLESLRLQTLLLLFQVRLDEISHPVLHLLQVLDSQGMHEDDRHRSARPYLSSKT